MPEEKQFQCGHCQRTVTTDAPGTKFRNHCPWCLWSVHVAASRVQDDRESTCRGLMEPIAVSVQGGEEWALVHRCAGCGEIKTNRVAGDDDMVALLCIALRPLASLPVPLEYIPEEARDRYTRFSQETRRADEENRRLEREREREKRRG